MPNFIKKYVKKTKGRKVLSLILIAVINRLYPLFWILKALLKFFIIVFRILLSRGETNIRDIYN